MNPQERRKLQRALVVTRQVLARIEDCDISTAREDLSIKYVIAVAASLLSKPRTRATVPQVRQTCCRHCEQDIENERPYPAGHWRDRGNNTHCPTPVGDAGQQHEPVLD